MSSLIIVFPAWTFRTIHPIEKRHLTWTVFTFLRIDVVNLLLRAGHTGNPPIIPIFGMLALFAILGIPVEALSFIAYTHLLSVVVHSAIRAGEAVIILSVLTLRTKVANAIIQNIL